MFRHVLVPVDATPLGSLLIERAVAYAVSNGSRITFLHLRADLSASGDGALLHSLSPRLFADAAEGSAQAVVAKAEAAARTAKVSAESVVMTGARVAETILAVAGERGCDLVFLASHGRRKGLKGALLGSVTRSVLEHADVPVLVVAVESNLAPRTAEQRALTLLREEHRSLAAVLHALLAQVDLPADQVSTELLGAMLFYIEHFPERLHHPKEDAHLFARLRQRSADCNELIDTLQAEHRAGAAQFARMRQLLAARDVAAFADAVREFATLQWRHMAHEEQVVLPAAGRHLLPEDWEAIADAFDGNDDPRFGAGESFDRLAARLLALAVPHTHTNGTH